MRHCVPSMVLCCSLLAALLSGCATDPAKLAEQEEDARRVECSTLFHRVHTKSTKGQSLRGAGMPRQALTEYEGALWCLERIKATDAGWNRDSMRTLERVIRREIDALNAELRLGDARAAEAISRFTTRRAADPSSPAPYAELGDFYFERGEYANAMRQYLEALDKDRGDVGVLINIARIHSRAGQLGKAKGLYQNIIIARPDLAVAHYNLGSIYFRQKKPTYALREYLRAVELQPTYPDAYNALGLVNKQLGHYDQAIVYFKTAIEQQPDHAAAYENLGLTFMANNNYPTAVNYLKKAIELFGPESPRGKAIADGMRHMHHYR
ncbi:MAG: tetratricopeptide repeat protein [Candidatus Aureabacteria bacterium]|nr:tetratricopeptide repeat protein [Candidatus Auribacterota bacterium]